MPAASVAERISRADPTGPQGSPDVVVDTAGDITIQGSTVKEH